MNENTVNPPNNKTRINAMTPVKKDTTKESVIIAIRHSNIPPNPSTPSNLDIQRKGCSSSRASFTALLNIALNIEEHISEMLAALTHVKPIRYNDLSWYLDKRSTIAANEKPASMVTTPLNCVKASY